MKRGAALLEQTPGCRAELRHSSSRRDVAGSRAARALHRVEKSSAKHGDKRSVSRQQAGDLFVATAHHEARGGAERVVVGVVVVTTSVCY